MTYFPLQKKKRGPWSWSESGGSVSVTTWWWVNGTQVLILCRGPYTQTHSLYLGSFLLQYFLASIKAVKPWPPES